MLNLDLPGKPTLTPKTGDDTTKESSRSLLWGTGMTKKVANKQQREFEKPKDFNPIDPDDVDIHEATKYYNPDVEIIPPTPNIPIPTPTKQDAIAALQDIVKDETVIDSSLPILPTSKEIIDPEDIIFDESQQEAIRGTLANQFSVIIGPAGCGKSTITQACLRRMEHQAQTVNYSNVSYDKSTGEVRYVEETSLSIALCAPTGAAVRTLRHIFPLKYRFKCSTIHMLLGFHPEQLEVENEHGRVETKFRFVPYYHRYNKLPHNIIILDEASMCTVDLWNKLWDACQPGTRIVMVGDINQLPPVYGKSILGFTMQEWPTHELRTIHRNAGLIIRNANKTLLGDITLEQQQVTEENLHSIDEVFQLITLPHRAVEAYDQARKVLMFLASKGQFNYKKDTFIVAENGRELGREKFNEELGLYFNKNKPIPINTGTRATMFAVGDKVMLLKNLNDVGLTNGMIGWVKDITLNGKFNQKRSAYDVTGGGKRLEAGTTIEELAAAAKHNAEREQQVNRSEEAGQRQASHILTVEFEGGIRHQFSTADDFNNVTQSYAVTCHKSQGAEYPTVVILCHHANSVLLTREWLYTAITRAQHKVFLLCSDRGLLQAMRTQRVKGNSLEEKIQSFVVANDAIDQHIPDIPKNKPVNPERRVAE